MKEQDFIRTYPGGSPVTAGTTVTIQKHVDNSVVASPTTDGNGMFTYSQDGSPGPIYYATTVSGQTKKHSGKTTGQAGTWFMADHPYYFLAFSDGVYQGINNAMAVSAPGGAMTVQVATGQCLAYGHLYVCTAATTLTIAGNSSGSTRVDLVVVQLVPPGNTEEGKIVLAIHQGTPGAGAPAVTQSGSLWEVALAQVSVANGASAISAGNLTDVRTYTASRIPNGYVTNAMLASGVAVANLGYTPANKAGDTFTGLTAVNFTGSGRSFTVANTSGGTDAFMVDAGGKVINCPNGAQLRLFSDAYGTIKFSVDGSTGNTHVYGNLQWDGSLVGTVPIGNGGTGQTTAAAAFNALSPMTTLGDIEYESGANTAARLAGNTSSAKKFLTQTGTGTVSAAPGWNAIAAGDVPTLNQDTTGKSAKTDALNSATTVVNVSAAAAPSSGQVLTATGSTAATWQTPSAGFSDPETTAGDMIYRNGSNATSRLAVGSANQVLMATGSPLLPSWQTLVYSSYPVVSGQATRDSIASGTATLSSTTGTTLFSANVTLLNSVVYDIWVWGWVSCVAGSVWVKAAASWNGNDGTYLGHSDAQSAHMLGFAMFLGTVTGTGSATAFGVKGKVDAASPVATIYSGEVNFMAISRT